MTAPRWPRLTVVSPGLIGGSIARGVRARGLAGEVVNVATGIDISVRDVADSVLAAVGADAEVVFVDERLGQVDRHIGSTDKLERLTGWRARTSFEQGLEQTVEWYRENEVWWRALTARDSVSSS